ncbi:hypothetical protein F2P81_020880 [Scophthalmus maximus]|uniref:Uncharacterized protein n=1 Tax=Scophthalmus maximus TaxID=52904 RepID=A0A6A4RVT2_SCOMX|nr:hypothetical protein F2P81_020880 [Scophthalmus maximus]
MPGGPFPPSLTVNQEACVTDNLFSSHKHGTPLEQALSTVLYRPQSCAARAAGPPAHRQSSSAAACQNIKPYDERDEEEFEPGIEEEEEQVEEEEEQVEEEEKEAGG